ncbi:MAG: alpha/beta fold hydrolase [Flavobacteriales bacterium]
MGLHHKILGSGQPLIIVHGLFGMLDNWMSLAKRYAEFYEVHLIDQRNHGHSFHHPEHNYKSMSQDLIEYIESKELKNVFLMGHSMGGKTAMYTASMKPNLIEKLISVDIGPKYYPPHHQDILKGLKAVEKAKVQSRKEADLVLSAHFDQLSIRQFLLKNLYWKTKTCLEFRFNLDAISQQIEEVGKALPSSFAYSNPSLFIRGARSSYILDDDVEAIENQFSDFHLDTVSNAGHWVHAENPDEFWDKTMQFLQFA